MTGLPAAAGKPVAGLKAKAKANPQLVIGGAAAAVVVLVALVSKKGSGVAEPGVDTAAATAAGGQLTPNQGGYYDSTANDVYRSLMGQFVTLQEQVSQLSSGPSTPTPAPTPPKVQTPAKQYPVMGLKPGTPLPKFDHYQNVGGKVYGIAPKGQTFWLTPSLYKALGSPAWVGKSTSAPPKPTVPKK